MWRSVVVGVCLAWAMVGAWAANPGVEVGKSVVLVSGAKSLAKIEQSAGSARQQPNAAAPGTVDLVYTAPDKPGSVTVSFENDGKAEKLVVEVTAAKGDNPYAPAGETLFAVFVLAVLLESALATIFNWSLFLRTFDAKGVKTLVSFAVAWMVVAKFDLDFIGRLAGLFFKQQVDLGWLGGALSALVLAGGSSGVSNLLQMLNIRSPRSAETVTPKPAPTEAWLAVRLQRQAAVGPVYVMSSIDGAVAQVIGTIHGNSLRSALARQFLRDPGRFPGSGGFAVKPGQARTLQLRGLKANGDNADSAIWGPFPLEAGAIVDVELQA